MLRTTKSVVDALASLLRAHEYAAEVGVDPWKFAVEWRLLKARGLEETDVRYLVARGLVDLRREISVPGAFERAFIPHDVPRLSGDTAFVLTAAGVSFCGSLNEIAESSDLIPDSDLILIATPASPPAHQSAASTPAKPHWNSNRRELTFGPQLVKCYRVPSPNQELILSVFQEEDWPEFVDDPLPPHDHLEPRRRLQATVKSLNRHQCDRLIRFRCNGSKIFWQSIHREE
jgi:hypothetical protein